VNLATLDSIYIALAFLVPGFVISNIRNQFLTGQERQGSELLIRYLCYSAINYATFGWILYIGIATQTNVFVKAIIWVLITLIGPAAIGLLAGISAQRDWFRKIYHWLGINPVHVIPTAWDYKFARMAGEWVLVVLKDGTKFAGFCGARSFASSIPNERDLFIQEIFDIDEDNRWIPTEKSVLIAHSEIRTVEFWPVKKENPNEQRETI